MNKAVFVLPFVIICLLAAIWGGWARIGISLPVTSIAVHHGSLMVNGFLASLIFLERAVTFKNKLILLLPIANALGVLLQLLGTRYAEYLTLGANAGFLLMCIYFIYRYKELYYYVFFAGAFCLMAGNIMLFKTSMYPAAIVWWMEFLLFTIVAERLELTRFLPLNNLKKGLLIAALIAVFLSALLPFHESGNIAFAIALTATAIWLLKYDMAFKSVKARGQHRYSGLLLITGYAWLIITGVLFVTWNELQFGYDAVLHSFFIGFVFSMIFSHAPIILPAVLGKGVKIYRPVLYWWFALLQLSLLVRIAADVFEIIGVRRAAGFINGVTIIAFFVSIVAIMGSELKKKRSVKA